MVDSKCASSSNTLPIQEVHFNEGSVSPAKGRKVRNYLISKSCVSTNSNYNRAAEGQVDVEPSLRTWSRLNMKSKRSGVLY